MNWTYTRCCSLKILFRFVNENRLYRIFVRYHKGLSFCYVLIEIISVQGKVVISYNPESNLMLFELVLSCQYLKYSIWSKCCDTKLIHAIQSGNLWFPLIFAIPLNIEATYSSLDAIFLAYTFNPPSIKLIDDLRSKIQWVSYQNFDWFRFAINTPIIPIYKGKISKKQVRFWNGYQWRWCEDVRWIFPVGIVNDKRTYTSLPKCCVIWSQNQVQIENLSVQYHRQAKTTRYWFLWDGLTGLARFAISFQYWADWT